MESIAFISQKGGSGKTTSLIMVAVSAGLLERSSVLILDTDTTQRSAATWGRRRSLPWPQVEICPLADVDRRLVRANEEGFDLVFVDTAGRDDAALPNLIRHSDFVAIPCRPSILDRDAVLPNIKACQRARVHFGVLMTCVKANTQARVQQIRIDHRLAGGVVLDAQFSDRVRYQSSIASGYSVSEMSGDAGLASEPIIVWQAIRSRLDVAASSRAKTAS